jgi:ATP-dependent RNA helicase DeaD
MSTSIELTTAESESSSNLHLFSDLGLSQEVNQAIGMAGYSQPTQVQSQVIPPMLAGRDVLAQSQTGTGKTAAFALPILSRLKLGQRLPQVLVLTPTRELALQVSEAFSVYAKCLPKLRIVAIYGGADYQPQLRALKNGVDIVVGTPGRLIDHLNRGTLRLEELQCLVLDEADEMLNMGFQEEMEQILQQTPSQKQVALFSATMPPAIRAIADSQLNDPVSVTVQKKTLTADAIRQRCVFVAERDKLDLLVRFLELEDTDGVIVFTRTKDSTVTVAEHLVRMGYSAAALNGDLPQARRQQTVDQLKSGRLNVLVATDVAARGLDVQRISHVFNYDLPRDSESYIHRIGRTGRAGRSGVATIFLTASQRGKLKLIERATRQTIEISEFPKARLINLKRVERLKKEITSTVESQDLADLKSLISGISLESEIDPLTIAAAIMHQAKKGRPFFMKDTPRERVSMDEGDDRGSRGRNSQFGGRRGERRDSAGGSGPESRAFGGGRSQRHAGGTRRSGRPAAGMQRYQLAVGGNDGVRPGNIVGAIANEAGIQGSDIGPIDIRANFSTIDLPVDLPPRVLDILRRTWVAGKQLKIRPFSPSKDHQSHQ